MDGHPDLLFAAIEGIERVEVSLGGDLGVYPFSLSPSAQGALVYTRARAFALSRGHEASFERGDEKGMLLFGGSTVIVLGEPGKWTLDERILEHTNEGVEGYLKMGQALRLTV